MQEDVSDQQRAAARRSQETEHRQARVSEDPEVQITMTYRIRRSTRIPRRLVNRWGLIMAGTKMVRCRDGTGQIMCLHLGNVAATYNAPIILHEPSFILIMGGYGVSG